MRDSRVWKASQVGRKRWKSGKIGLEGVEERGSKGEASGERREARGERRKDCRVCAARQVSRPPTYRSARVNAAKVARPTPYSRFYFFFSRSRIQTSRRATLPTEKKTPAIPDKRDFPATWPRTNRLIGYASRRGAASYCKRDVDATSDFLQFTLLLPRASVISAFQGNEFDF